MSARRLSLCLLLLAFAAPPADTRGQWPAEVVGDVFDVDTGEPVPFATIAVPGTGRQVAADGAGRFHVRLPNGGRISIQVSRFGYSTRAVVTETAAGSVTRVRVALTPDPIPADPVVARMAADPAGVYALDHEAIERSGALTVGDLVRRVPGVVVRRSGLGGPEVASIRGSAPDAVLVLVDGVAINDPVTGTADLGTVPASNVESIVVAPGAQSARYGARARGGVIVIEARAPRGGASAWIAAGSQASRSLGGEFGVTPGGWALSAGGEHEASEGGFDFRLPEIVGGIAGRRANADYARSSVFAAFDGPVLGGSLGFRGAFEGGERGLPGKAFAPAPEARQSFDRQRATFTWRRTHPRRTDAVTAHAVAQDLRHRDPAPPLGPVYDDATALHELGLGLETTVRHTGRFRETELRGEVRRRDIRADALDTETPAPFTDVGAAIAITAGVVSTADLDIAFNGQARIDRDDVTARVFLTHGADLTARTGRVELLLAHRSAYSPPALGDLFFDASIGVSPNPMLRPERVVGEIEARLSYDGGPEIPASVGIAAYRADVDDMIEWTPDFRFIWSPRNFDVERRGGEAWLIFTPPEAGLSLETAYAYARARYAPGEQRGSAQIVYRPRHTARTRVDWSGGGWRAHAEARFTGSRTTAPTDHNRLPGFWAIDLGVARTWTTGPVEVETRLDIDHLNDQTRSLIFGFPEPGRRARLALTFRPNPETMKGGTQ